MKDKEIKKKIKKLGVTVDDFLKLTEAYFCLISMAKKYGEKQMKDAYDLLKEIMKEE